MSQPFVGEIRPFAFTFAPRGWAFCDGQILPLAQNTELFALLGTFYGGNGQTTFALPDLRGRAPIGSGQGPGLSLYDLGETGGISDVALTTSEMPAHGHVPGASSAAGNRRDPFSITPAVGHRWAGSNQPQYSAVPADATMAPGVVGAVGGGLPHENRSPFLAVNFCIALQGIFPARN